MPGFVAHASASDAIRRLARSLGLPVDLDAVCPSVDAEVDAVAARLAERSHLAALVDPEALIGLLKEASR